MLSKQERVNFIVATGAQETITRWLDYNNSLTAEERKYIKTGKSFIRKALKQMIERLSEDDPDATKQLVKDAKRQSLVLEPKRSNLSESVTINAKQFELLTDIVVSDCQERPEEWCAENHKTCLLKQALVGCGVQYKNKEKGCRTCRYREK